MMRLGKKADTNDTISIFEIAKTGGANPSMIQYIREVIENQNALTGASVG